LLKLAKAFEPKGDGRHSIPTLKIVVKY